MSDMDEAMNEPTADAEPDVALHEATPLPKRETAEAGGIDPEDFDLGAWLRDDNPAVAYYPMGRWQIPLRVRSPQWSKELAEKHNKGGEVDGEQFLIELVAGHIVGDPTPEQIRERFFPADPDRPQLWRDFNELADLVLQLGQSPLSKIDPAFLRGASG